MHSHAISNPFVRDVPLEPCQRDVGIFGGGRVDDAVTAAPCPAKTSVYLNLHEIDPAELRQLLQTRGAYRP